MTILPLDAAETTVPLDAAGTTLPLDAAGTTLPLDAEGTTLPLDAAGRRPAFFEQDGMDQVVSMVVELAAELWVVKERLFIVEAVLAGHGLAVREAVERYVPSEAERETLAKMRAGMTEQMFRTLGREHRRV